MPEPLINFITGFFYGWKGNYKSWEEAQKRSTGYNSSEILEKVFNSALKVKNGEAIYERDSVLFEKIQYSFPVLSALMWIAAQNNSKINVLDFGGSLGSSYYQNKFFLETLDNYKWCIVEQENFVKKGIEHFTNDKIQFYHTIDQCIQSNSIDLIIFSSVLQYLEKPYDFLEYIKTKKFKFILIDRTGYFNKPDRITIQKVHPLFYKATYPCWFFNKAKFLTFFKQDFELIFDFNTSDKANISSEFKGFLFKSKN